MKKGFTLAEIMIALVVIGVITSILLPVAFNNVPNENVMKFKKADATLAKVLSELIASGEYYASGDLSKKADGTTSDGDEYFCKSFSDLLSTKNIECATNKANIAYCSNTKNTFLEKYVIPRATAAEIDNCAYGDATTGGGFLVCYTPKCRAAYNKKENYNAVLDGKKNIIFKGTDGKADTDKTDGAIAIGYYLVTSCPCYQIKMSNYTDPPLNDCNTKNMELSFYTNNGTLATTLHVVYPQSSPTAHSAKEQAYNEVLKAYEKEQNKEESPSAPSNSSSFSNISPFKHCPINHTPSTDGYISTKANEEDSNGDYLENVAKEKLDELCAKYGSEEIKTSDNIIYYQTDPTTPFGKNEYCNKNSDGFLNVYKVVCVDIDGIKKGEKPFGYGVRLDGKIMRGKRAGEWLNKSIQDKE